MRYERRRRSPRSPKPCRNFSGCAARCRHRGPLTMTTCPPISMNSVTNLRAALRRSWKADRTRTMLAEMPLAPWLRFNSDFIALAHRHQEPPAAANNGGPWTTWLMLGGRGAGKTRAEAEWVRALALGLPPYAAEPARN